MRVQELPVWMVDAAFCRAMRSAAEPVVALDALETLSGVLRDVKQRTAADAVPNARVASPESRGEHHATAPSSVSKAASTIGAAFGGSGDAECRAPLEQLAGSDPAALTGLLTRLMEAHAANAGLPLPRSGADEQ